MTDILKRDRHARIAQATDGSDLSVHQDFYNFALENNTKTLMLSSVENIIADLEAMTRLAQQEKSYLLGELGEI